MAEGGTSLRSVVYFEDGETPVAGQEAENLLLADPANGVRHWKRSMGSDKVLHTTPSGRAWTAEDIAQFLLETCKASIEAEIGRVVQAAVISVPANYTDDQKSATIRAGEAAGFDHVDLIHEPTSASISFLGNNEREAPDGLRIIFDEGGGTLDISICEKRGNRYEIKTTSGVPALGGMDYTQKLYDHCVSEFRSSGGSFDEDSDLDAAADLWRRVETGKINLNGLEKVSIPVLAGSHKHLVTITKDEARQLWKPLGDQMLACLRTTLDEIEVELGDILELIPVGGGSQCFYVQEELASFFGRPISDHSDPIHAVANGAALHAWTRHDEVDVGGGIILPSPDYKVRDVTAHGLGVMALDGKLAESFSVVLKKGVALPSCFSKTFQMHEDGATDALIELYQGQSGQDISSCAKLGNFELQGLPPVFGRPHKIEIEFRIDENGMVNASARDMESGKCEELAVAYQRAT